MSDAAALDAPRSSDGPTPGARPVPFRGGGFRPTPRRWVGPLVFAVLIAVWEIGSRTGWISPIVLPAPSEALEAFLNLARSGQLALHLQASLSRLIQGWIFGTLLGIVFGFAAGLFSLARAGIVPLVAAIFPIPKIALLPLFIIWFGIGEESKVATILFGTFFPTVIAVYGGVDGVDRGLVRMGQSFGLSRWSIIRKIVLPGAMPGILSGLRVSLAIAIILLTAAEMIGARYGIGAFILAAGNLYQTDQLLAGVVMLSILGLVFAQGIAWLERRLLAWR